MPLSEQEQLVEYRRLMGAEAAQRQAKIAADEQKWGPCSCGSTIQVDPVKAAPGPHHRVTCGRFNRGAS